MASLNAGQTKRALLKKGFKKAEGDHHFFVFEHNGKIIAKTKMSHNDQDIRDHLISKMYKQCKISKNEFIGLVDCHVSQEDYVNSLKKQGLL